MKVLYILGYSRSGSTILDNVLNELAGFHSVGELRYLWERIVQGRWCGCGIPVMECPFWSEVLSRSFPTGSFPTPEQVVRSQQEAVGAAKTWKLLGLAERPESWSAPLRAYSEITQRIYRRAGEVAGTQVIVDSSKRPSNGALLALLPEVSPYFLHLVRDPRAVAYSETRSKANPDGGERVEMARSNVVMSAARWVTWNAAADAVRHRFSPHRAARMKYEDFVSNPKQSLEAIAKLVREPLGDTPFVDDETVQLAGNHTVSGNPVRFSRGLVRLRADNEWITEMPQWQKVLTTTTTLPLLASYGYRIGN
jgi:hypothetical protein